MTVVLKVDTRYTDRDEESPKTPRGNADVHHSILKTYLAVVVVGFLAVGMFLRIYSHTRDNQSDKTSTAEIHSDGALGISSNYLYMLGDDPTELYNRYSTAGYTNVAAEIYKNASAMQSLYQLPTIPTSTGKVAAFAAARGVSPWVTSTNTARTITQKYSYSQAPHIIFFLVDDWGYNDAGYQSTYLNWTTPNIDKLMRSGIRLTNYFSHELCTPTRAALMTGRYASRFGMHGDTSDELNLPLSEVTLAEEMHSAGYRSYLVGKWHLGRSEWAYTPTYRGFDYFYGFYGGFIDYWTKTDGNTLDLHEGTSLVTNANELSTSMHSAYLYQKKAEAVISSHATNFPNTPMFLYYASQLIHDTWEAPQLFIDRCAGGTTDQQTYCGMNLMLDEVVGNLTCALKRAGLFENTLFVLASDNGGANTMPGSSYPWRGGKGSLWRGGTSVAAFMYGTTNLIPASQQGTSYDGIHHVTDWLPTLMGVATNNAWTGGYTGNQMDGVNNFHSIVTNSASKRHEILHFLNAAGNISYQYDNVKGILNTFKTVPFQTPDHVFVGNSSLAVDHCSFMSSMSAVPHTSPSYSPTLAGPTLRPTSAAPTKKPKASVAPASDAPASTNPSLVPSALSSPSYRPSLRSTQTSDPTFDPSTVPTDAPSDVPDCSARCLLSPKQSLRRRCLRLCLAPTLLPTTFPTTLDSTTVPTTEPSTAPSPWFTQANTVTTFTPTPSVTPIVAPTTFPSFVPSDMPTTIAPTLPTDVPSYSPAPVRSRVPSVALGDLPTRKPSVRPKPTVTPV